MAGRARPRRPGRARRRRRSRGRADAATCRARSRCKARCPARARRAPRTTAFSVHAHRAHGRVAGRRRRCETQAPMRPKSERWTRSTSPPTINRAMPVAYSRRPGSRGSQTAALDRADDTRAEPRSPPRPSPRDSNRRFGVENQRSSVPASAPSRTCESVCSPQPRSSRPRVRCSPSCCRPAPRPRRSLASKNPTASEPVVRARRAACRRGARSSTGSAPCRRPGTSSRPAPIRCWARRSTRRRRRCRRRSTAASRRLQEPVVAGGLRPRRPDHPGAGRRHDRRPLQELRPQQPALDALPRRALRDELRRRVHPEHLGAGRRREAGADLHLPARGRPPIRRASGPTTTTRRRWTRRSAAACTARSRSAPRGRRSPTASSSSSSRSSSTSTRSTASRSSTTRRRSAPRSATSCSGTCSALGDDIHSFHVHGHRWMRPDGPRDVQTVSPAESFAPLEGGQGRDVALPLPVEEHMTNGMIGLYVVTK